MMLEQSRPTQCSDMVVLVTVLIFAGVAYRDGRFSKNNGICQRSKLGMKRTAGTVSAASQVTRRTATPAFTNNQSCKTSNAGDPPNQTWVVRVVDSKEMLRTPSTKGMCARHARPTALTMQDRQLHVAFCHPDLGLGGKVSRSPTWAAQLNFISQVHPHCCRSRTTGRRCGR